MLKGCLTVVGVAVAIVVGIVIYFAVRGESAISAATVNGAALTTVRVGQTRSHVDQVLGKAGSGDSTVFGSGHPRPAGTTCRYFIAKNERHLKHLPVHRLCFSDSGSNRVASIVVYEVKP
jgi:hypothetical protein